VRRTIDEAFFELRQQLESWINTGSTPGIRIFVYPPEWEPRMLAGFPAFAKQCSTTIPLAMIDVGQGFLTEVERRKGLIERLEPLECRARGRVLDDLGEIAQLYLSRILAARLDPPPVARLLVNTGALGTFTSYSAIMNALYGDTTAERVAAPTVLAFPGEGDERELNLLRLRADANYRVPRI
jgi:hypothetical protein